MLLLLLGVACGPPPVPASQPGISVSTLPASLRGLSGLTVDEAGGLWAVSERTPALVPLRLDGERVVEAGAAIRISGWPADVDAESIAWLAPGRFAVGAEPRELGDRDSDWIMTVVVTAGAPGGDEARVTFVREVLYAPFHVLAEANRGLEGLAATPSALVAAGETVLTGPSGREAPLWRIARADDEQHSITTSRLRLTSETGKISGIAARDEGATTRLIAVERHYEVSRIVTADITWGTADVPSVAEATVLRDLGPLLSPMPNLEGLVWLPDGRVVLLADNDSGEWPGPVVAVVVAGP